MQRRFREKATSVRVELFPGHYGLFSWLAIGEEEIYEKTSLESTIEFVYRLMSLRR